MIQVHIQTYNMSYILPLWTVWSCLGDPSRVEQPPETKGACIGLPYASVCTCTCLRKEFTSTYKYSMYFMRAIREESLAAVVENAHRRVLTHPSSLAPCRWLRVRDLLFIRQPIAAFASAADPRRITTPGRPHQHLYS